MIRQRGGIPQRGNVIIRVTGCGIHGFNFARLIAQGSGAARVSHAGIVPRRHVRKASTEDRLNIQAVKLNHHEQQQGFAKHAVRVRAGSGGNGNASVVRVHGAAFGACAVSVRAGTGNGTQAARGTVGNRGVRIGLRNDGTIRITHHGMERAHELIACRGTAGAGVEEAFNGRTVELNVAHQIHVPQLAVFIRVQVKPPIVQREVHQHITIGSIQLCGGTIGLQV